MIYYLIYNLKRCLYNNLTMEHQYNFTFDILIQKSKDLLSPYKHKTFSDVYLDNTIDSELKKVILGYVVLFSNLFTNSSVLFVELMDKVFSFLKNKFTELKEESLTQKFFNKWKENITKEEDDSRYVVKQDENGEWNATIVQKSELEPELEPELEQMKKEDINVLEEQDKDKDI